MEQTVNKFWNEKTKQIIQLILIFASPLILYIFNKSSFALVLFLLSLFMIYTIKLKGAYKLLIAAVDALVIIPLLGVENGTYLTVITQIGIYAVLSVGLNIVIGFAGLLNLGYVAFYAVGAYTYAILGSPQANNFIPGNFFPLSGGWFWLFLVVATAISALVGFLLGLPVLRLRGDYLAIVTLGFAEIIRIVFNNLDKPLNITNGPKGIMSIKPPEIFGIVFNKPVHYYFLVLVLFVLTIIVTQRLNNSRIGRAWTAIREDETAAKTMGVPVVRMKLLAFTIGASFAGLMGVIFAAKMQFIDPTSFGFMESIGILAMVIMGGLGNIGGVVLGAMAVVVLQLQLLKDLAAFLRDLSTSGILNIPSQLDPSKFEKLVFGLILILMCIFRPQGLLPVKRTLQVIKSKVVKAPKKENSETLS